MFYYCFKIDIILMLNILYFYISIYIVKYIKSNFNIITHLIKPLRLIGIVVNIIN
jgi:hypothetical protein